MCVEGAKGDYIMRGCIVQRNLEKEGGGGLKCRGTESPWGQRSECN